MKIKRNTKRGISLIVLVITIIVMIILAAAIILSLNSSGIIGKADKAKMDTDNATVLEAAGVAYAEYQLEKQLGELDFADQSGEEYVKNKLSQSFGEDSVKNLNILSDGTIQILPKIPKGFVMSPYKGEQKVSEGLVIYRATANDLSGKSNEEAMTSYDQYVWIPVYDVARFVRRDGYKNVTLQTNVSAGSTTEPFSKGTITEANDLTGEYAEYKKMKSSVEKNNGFYIARYEAGTSIQRKDTANGTSADVLSQKDKYAYNYVGWGPSMESTSGDIIYSSRNQGKGAVELARCIYPEEVDEEVVSTLIYGIQWDAVVDFMKEIENPTVDGKKYIEDSTGMGWYNDNYEAGNAYHKTGVDIGEKSLNKVKNLYDMAGNVFEWTMEASSTNIRIFRGGHYAKAGLGSSVSSRNNLLPGNAAQNYGFRVALYIK